MAGLIHFRAADGRNDTPVDAANPLPVALGAAESHLGAVGGHTANPQASFARPADTTAYASGDLVANSTTAGQVAALALSAARTPAGGFTLRRCKLHKSGTGVSNAVFRVHLYLSAPTPAGGDNAAFSTSGAADWLGAMEVGIDRAFTDGAAGFGLPLVGGDINVKLTAGQTIHALIEARAAYAPASGETFTLTVEGLQD